MNATLSTGMRWYAVQCLSNHEDKVRRYLAKYKEEDEHFAKDLNEVLVPIETVSEVKNGKKRQRDRKFYPGYVFVEMKLFFCLGSFHRELTRRDTLFLGLPSTIAQYVFFIALSANN